MYSVSEHVQQCLETADKGDQLANSQESEGRKLICLIMHLTVDCVSKGSLAQFSVLREDEPNDTILSPSPPNPSSDSKREVEDNVNLFNLLAPKPGMPRFGP